MYHYTLDETQKLFQLNNYVKHKLAAVLDNIKGVLDSSVIQHYRYVILTDNVALKITIYTYFPNVM